VDGPSIALGMRALTGKGRTLHCASPGMHNLDRSTSKLRVRPTGPVQSLHDLTASLVKRRARFPPHGLSRP
jgi:hypothetical protein